MTLVNPLDDVMIHFYMIFLAYIVLFIVVGANLYKTISINKISKENRTNIKSMQIIDLVINGLCIVAMAGGMMFMGVLADNNALNYGYWWNLLLGLSVVSFIVFIINVILVYKNI